MPKNRNKNQKTTLISSQKESLDRDQGVHPYGADTDLCVRKREHPEGVSLFLP
jgi:hypothetical protein